MSAQLTTTGVTFPDSTTQTTAATGVAGANGSISINSTLISAPYTIAANTNGFSVSPITIVNGASVTAGQKWVVI